jgi:uncharacterized protein YndB with AHSA1/START domain
MGGNRAEQRLGPTVASVDMSTVRKSVIIGAPPSDVWRVLTTRDLVREWASVFADDIDILTNWKPGARVTWKADRSVVREGVVAAVEPERRLAFEYRERPEEVWSETYELGIHGEATRLELTVGPVSDADAGELAPKAEAAVEAIQGLAEELAAIQGR